MAFQDLFFDDFAVTCGRGSFISTYGRNSSRTARWDAYPEAYLTTKGQKHIDPNNPNSPIYGYHYSQNNVHVISGFAGATGSGNVMVITLDFDAKGIPTGAAPEPLINPDFSKSQLYGRYTVRAKGINLKKSWHIAWLLWPLSEVWPRDGEQDQQEGDITSASLNANLHWQGGVDGGSFTRIPLGAGLADWHTYVTEWTPNSIKCYVDGSLVGSTTKQVPNTKMRQAMQSEPSPGSDVPTESAQVAIDFIKVEKYTESTPLTPTRRNYFPAPRPGRNMELSIEYEQTTGSPNTQSYAVGDDLRVDCLNAPSDTGRIWPVQMTAGTYTASIDVETLGGATNGAFLVKRQSDGVILGEQHVTTNNTKKRLSITFTVSGTQWIEFVMAQGAYTGLSQGAVYFRNVLLEAGSTAGVFFDGATVDTADIVYDWVGTEYKSASTASQPSSGTVDPGGGGNTTPPPVVIPPSSPGTNPAIEAMAREVWVGYKHRYVRGDGAVMQREADNKVPSEAIAYGMKMALQLGDRATFDLINQFATNVLERRNWKPGGPDNWRAGGDNDPRVLAPSLMAWDYRVGPFNSNPANTVNDWNFATDADNDRGKALYWAAAKGWGPNAGQDYLNKALEISKQVDLYGHNIGADGKGYLTSDEYGQSGPVTQSGRTPGHHQFSGGGEFEANPSYFDPVFDHLAKDIGKNARFAQHLAGGYNMLDKATDNVGGLSPNIGLIPDWLSWNLAANDAFPLQAGSRGWSYSRATFQKYDAFRSWHRLRWAYDAYRDPEALTLLARGAAAYQQLYAANGNKIPAEAELNGTILSGGYDNAIFTAGAYLALTANPANSAAMTLGQTLYTNELDPTLLYATDNEGYKFWASDKDNKGGDKWSYFGDSWLMFFFLRQCGLWINYGQTVTPVGGINLNVSEASTNAADSVSVSTLRSISTSEASTTAVDDIALSVPRGLAVAELGANATDSVVLTVAGQPDQPAPDAPPVVDVLVDRWEWVSRTAGVTFDLTKWIDGVAFLRGSTGLVGGPPSRSTTRKVPGLPGAVRGQTIHDTRKIVLPLMGLTNGYEEMMSLVRKMVLLMDPVTNEGLLRFTRKNGEVLELSAQVIRGLEVDNLGDKGPNAQDFGIELEAVDPYWYSEVRTKTFGIQSAVDAVWFPFPDLVLGASNVIGEVAIDVDSDVPTWPVWTAVGPGSNLTLMNVTSEQVLAMDDTAVLKAGETIRIDTRPRGETARSVNGPGSTKEERNWFGKLTSRSLWPLEKGRNQLNIAFANAGPGSYVALEYRDAKLTP